MTAYYNEIDPYAAQWLRNLIAAGHIAPGDVDERSIVDVRAADLDGFAQCHFFAGIGGWSLALRTADWPDDRPVWTGSCPCQPFSLAGARKGFDDDRHLWPVWRGLIAERRPAKVFGEQVASAADWLRLVRSDLEAMEYAVGAMPIEAASAGADHLRDRFWFVADAARHRQWWSRQSEASGEPHVPAGGLRSGSDMADADYTRSQGREILPERAGERIAGPHGLADADQLGAREEWQQRSGQFGGAGGDQEARDGDVSDAEGEHVGAAGQSRQHGGMEWVIGADGKARRVKSGIRLLAHGFPNRVGLLRGFGNAIDPRPAAAFIRASEEALVAQNAGLSVGR